MSGENTYFDNDGKSVDVTLSYTVPKDQVAVVEGWLGIANRSGDSGDSISLNIDNRAYQFTVPAGLAVAKGAVVYITVATVTGHTPDDAAYTTTAGAGKVAFFKALEAKDANNMVVGLMLASAALAS